jgi:hypothetical protein
MGNLAASFRPTPAATGAPAVTRGASAAALAALGTAWTIPLTLTVP